jgi:DNA-binding MarR family transcriptional regulator
MPGRKKSDFVTAKYPRLRDPFYFDPDAWARLEAWVAGKKDRTRRGDKRPREEVERMRASFLRNRKARQEAAAERSHAARRAKVALPGALIREVLCAWDPDACYGSGDIARVTGIDRHKIDGVLRPLEARGYIERLRNEAFERNGGTEPEFLWRLTEQGAQKRTGALRARQVGQESAG